MKCLLLLALAHSLFGCAIAFPDKDKGINSNAATTKKTVYISSTANAAHPCHDDTLSDELTKKLEQLNFIKAEDKESADLAISLDSECGFTQKGKDQASIILPLASFFILPITTTTEYSVRVQTYEYGRRAKEYSFDEDINVVTHPFYFEQARGKYPDYVKRAMPSMSSKIVNALEGDHFL